MKLLLAALAGAAALAATSASVAGLQAVGPIRNTTQGAVLGLYEKNTESFLGIPFAAAPVGSLRWQPPAAAGNWSGVREATKFGNSCYQGHGAFTFATNVSEDCLFLNVYVPSNPKTSGPLPVSVALAPGLLQVQCTWSLLLCRC